MTNVDISAPVSVPCAGGTLAFEPNGRVTAWGHDGGERTVVVADLALNNLVELWCGDGYAYLVGLKGRSAWFARPAAGQLTEVLDLDRLDLRGSYDPGGLHRVEFRELPDGDLLIVHELGLARLRPDGRVLWHKAHDDLTAHLDRLTGDTAWFRAESGFLGFMLADGRPVVDS